MGWASNAAAGVPGSSPGASDQVTETPAASASQSWSLPADFPSQKNAQGKVYRNKTGDTSPKCHRFPLNL